MVIIVMGVAGAGKTTVGTLLAKKAGWDFVDADALHPSANIEKMRRGVPLNDSDREPWLAQLRVLITRSLAAGRDIVIACSALKRRYRERLQVDRARVRIVYLKADYATLRQRLRRRRRHFMPARLLPNQLRVLEEPKAADVLTLDARRSPAALVAAIRAAFKL